MKILKVLTFSSIDDVQKTCERYDKVVDKVCKAVCSIIDLPLHIFEYTIRKRLQLTDWYLETKAKAIEGLFKEMSFKRKRLAKEQLETRKLLKEMRKKLIY